MKLNLHFDPSDSVIISSGFNFHPWNSHHLTFFSKSTVRLQFFKGCLPQISLGPSLNTLSSMILDYLVIPQPRTESFYQNQILLIRQGWSCESNVFSMSIVTKYPPILLRSHISIISDINLPSPINLFLVYAVCCFEIKIDRTFFSFWNYFGINI